MYLIDHARGMPNKTLGMRILGCHGGTASNRLEDFRALILNCPSKLSCAKQILKGKRATLAHNANAPGFLFQDYDVNSILA